MAKGSSGLDDIFKKTERRQVDTTDLDRGIIQSTGVGLREGEIDALDRIGAELGEVLGTRPVARNALIRLATRSFLESYLAGEVSPADLAGRFTKPDKPNAKLDL